MADDRSEPRETNWRQLLPWTILFQGFRVALDPNKLLLAAGGILAMACGWWLLAQVFSPGIKPQPGEYRNRYPGEEGKQWTAFKTDYQHWSLLYETAGREGSQGKEIVGAGDLATTQQEFDILQPIENDLRADKLTRAQVPEYLNRLVQSEKITRQQAQLWSPQLGIVKPVGQLRTWPWFEDRGPNQYLLVTGQARTTTLEPGQTVLNWFLTDQVPVLIEPLVKMFLPVRYFFSLRAGTLARFYFILVMVWTLATWALFGGAIARIAAVQVTRQEKIGMVEAVRFAARRYVSLVTAPLFPMVIVALLVILMIIFGAFHLIPIVGDVVVDGIFWWLPVLLGLAMAVVLVGLVGWPFMAATISTEGTDTWEAVSRSYSYVFQAPWHYIFYTFMALVYGAVVVFFVGFMGSFAVYLAKWGVSQTPGTQLADRDPSYLFVYAPTSFHWRDLLLQGGQAQLRGPDDKVEVRPLTVGDRIDQTVLDKYVATFKVWNYIGAFLVGVWLTLMFLLILGFGYSYFWTASTIIYLLMRRKVDEAEMDEVYLEEEDQDLPYAPVPAPVAPPAPVPAPAGTAFTMVEPPALRTPSAAPSPPPAPPSSKEEVTAAPRPQQAPLPPADRPVNPPPRADDGSPPAGPTT